MQLVRAFTYVRDDPEWLGKLAICVILAFASLILMPFVGLGLFPLAVLLGYMLEIARNVRKEKTPLLPKWDNYADLLARGAGVLPAMIVYNLPLVLASVCVALLPSNFGDEAVRGFATLSALLCLGPLALIYLAIIWPMLAAGVAHYIDDRGETRHFFEVARLFEETSSIRAESIQWVLIVLILNLTSSIVSVILPCIGWIIIAGLTFPVHGHLLGQYARLLDADHKRKIAALRKSR